MENDAFPVHSRQLEEVQQGWIYSSVRPSRGLPGVLSSDAMW